MFKVEQFPFNCDPGINMYLIESPLTKTAPGIPECEAINIEKAC